MSIVMVGSTSGSITLQEPAIAGSTVLSLPAVSGTILTTTSPKAGNVIQVVQGVTASGFSFSTSSATPVASSFTVSITPTSSSSKILVLFNGGNCYVSSSGAQSYGYIYRSIGGGAYSSISSDFLSIIGQATTTRTGISMQYLDSPATTSATTYQMYGSTNAGTTNWGQIMTMTLMEIAA